MEVWVALHGDELEGVFSTEEKALRACITRAQSRKWAGASPIPTSKKALRSRLDDVNENLLEAFHISEAVVDGSKP